MGLINIVNFTSSASIKTAISESARPSFPKCLCDFIAEMFFRDHSCSVSLVIFNRPKIAVISSGLIFLMQCAAMEKA